MDVLEHYRSIVWPFIESYLNGRLKDGFHRDIILNYPRRMGKYLRPSLVMITAGAMGLDINQTIPTAAAIQISEDWILNHDDIEDDSDQRRGEKSLHKMFGLPLALNAGDALHALNWQLIYTINNKAIFEEFSQIINRTTHGQTLDIKYIIDNNFNLSLDDVYQIIESKTCYYTIAGPMRLGAILAGATSDQLDLIYKFGLSLGKAFQIIDDYLDLTSTFDGQKNQVGNDIYESKRTVFLVHLLQHCKDPKIIEILSRPRHQKTEADVQFIIKLMQDNGSLEFGFALAKEFAATALNIFQKDLLFLNQEPFRQELAQIIDFIVNRKK